MFFTKVLASTSNHLKTAYRQIWVGGGVLYGELQFTEHFVKYKKSYPKRYRVLNLKFQTSTPVYVSESGSILHFDIFIDAQ